MSVEKLIMALIISLFQGISGTVIIFRQYNKKTIKEVLKVYAFFSIYAILSFLFVPNQIRLILFILLTSLFLYFILKIKNRIVILYSFCIELILAISEIISTLLLVLIGINSNEIVQNPNYNLVVNVLNALIAIIIVNLPFIEKLTLKIRELFKKRKKLIYYVYLFLAIIYIVVSKNGLELILKSNYYLNVLFIIAIVFIITVTIRKELKNEQLNEANMQMLNYVTKYEKIITDQGKANHEFKNQLMVIKGYVQLGERERLNEYLEEVIEDTRNTHSSYIISQLNKFPDGGVKGLLYYKLSIMEDNKINYEINVENGIKTSLKSLKMQEYKDLTKILGVLLDNAIDASKKSNDRNVIIDVKKAKESVVFTISNTYKGKIDLSKIGTGYSTKGKGHGYGLRLAKDIIDKNNILKIENSIEGNYYNARLIIINNQKKRKK